jgi:predicted aldo/keto reductase-like oxidoreductase
VLVALNAADSHRLPFAPAVLAEAARRGMGVIGMKAAAQGAVLERGGLSMREALGYVLSLGGVSTVIVGCRTPDEVDANAEIARSFTPLAASALRALEERTRRCARDLTYYKKP